MALEKLLRTLGQGFAGGLCMARRGARDVFRSIATPTLCDIECDGLDRIVELTGYQVRDDRSLVRIVKVGLTVADAELAEVIEHDVHRRVPPGHHGWCV